MQQRSMPGNAHAKRRQWSRKCRVGQELKFGAKLQKHQFQRQFRNGKPLECPRKGNHYRKLGSAAKWNKVN